MKTDLTFRHKETECNFQFRYDGQDIRWRSWSDGDTPEHATINHIWLFGETDRRENERLIRSAMDLPRFTERDKKRVLNWFFKD